MDMLQSRSKANTLYRGGISAVSGGVSSKASNYGNGDKIIEEKDEDEPEFKFEDEEYFAN